MRYESHVRSRPPFALPASLGLLALALCVTALPGGAADTPSKPAADTNVRITAVPPAIYVDTAAAAKDDATAPASEAKRAPHARTDTDEEFDFDVFTNQMQKTPWVIGLIFLVVGSIFLTPVVLLVGIIWYKLRKTRMQNEALLRLAEKGVMPPAQAVDAKLMKTGAARTDKARWIGLKQVDGNFFMAKLTIAISPALQSCQRSLDPFQPPLLRAKALFQILIHSTGPFIGLEERPSIPRSVQRRWGAVERHPPGG